MVLHFQNAALRFDAFFLSTYRCLDTGVAPRTVLWAQTGNKSMHYAGHLGDYTPKWGSVGFFSSDSAARGSARRHSQWRLAVIDIRDKMGSFRATLRQCLGKNETEVYPTWFPVVL